MAKITKASFARAKKALGIKKVTKKNIGRIAKKASGGGKSRSRKVTKTKRKTKKRTYRKLGRRNNRGGRRKFTIPLAPIAGLLAGLAMPIKMAVDGKFDDAAREVALNYTGWNAWQGKFEIDRLARGLGPLIIGMVVHKFVGGPPLNVNRMLAAANVPFIRI